MSTFYTLSADSSAKRDTELSVTNMISHRNDHQITHFYTKWFPHESLSKLPYVGNK